MALLNGSFKFMLSLVALSFMLSIKAQLLTGKSVILGKKHYYIETLRKGNFFDAAYACAKLDMTLASIANEDEYNSLFGFLKTSKNLVNPYWLSGITYEGASAPFTWLGTGKLVDYCHDSTAPNPDTDKCLYTNATDFKCNSQSCTGMRYNYICEKPVEPNCGKLGQCRYTYSYRIN